GMRGSEASGVVPVLRLCGTALDKGVAVFFITARRDSQRQATLWNLDRAGYEGWARLITRGDRNDDDVQQFKTKQREKVAAAGYTIIANMGDLRRRNRDRASRQAAGDRIGKIEHDVADHVGSEIVLQIHNLLDAG